MSITEEMANVAVTAFLCKFGAARADVEEGIRSAVEAVAPLIGATRLGDLATELQQVRDRVECADPTNAELLGEYNGRKDGLQQAAGLARDYADLESDGRST